MAVDVILLLSCVYVLWIEKRDLLVASRLLNISPVFIYILYRFFFAFPLVVSELVIILSRVWHDG